MVQSRKLVPDKLAFQGHVVQYYIETWVCIINEINIDFLQPHDLVIFIIDRNGTTLNVNDDSLSELGLSKKSNVILWD